MTMPKQKPGRSKQDYGTPPELINAVRWRLQIEDFDMDLAANEKNSVCGRRYFSQEANALVQPWAVGKGWNWLNPPFAHIEPWVKKAYREMLDYGARTAMLVPAGVGSNWWRDWVHQKARVLLMNGRVTFVGERQCYPKDTCLLLYEVESRKGYEVWQWKHERMSSTPSKPSSTD